MGVCVDGWWVCGRAGAMGLRDTQQGTKGGWQALAAAPPWHPHTAPPPPLPPSGSWSSSSGQTPPSATSAPWFLMRRAQRSLQTQSSERPPSHTHTLLLFLSSPLAPSPLSLHSALLLSLPAAARPPLPSAQRRAPPPHAPLSAFDPPPLLGPCPHTPTNPSPHPYPPRRHYWYEFFMDELPIWGFVGPPPEQTEVRGGGGGRVRAPMRGGGPGWVGGGGGGGECVPGGGAQAQAMRGWVGEWVGGAGGCEPIGDGGSPPTPPPPPIPLPPLHHAPPSAQGDSNVYVYTHKTFDIAYNGDRVSSRAACVCAYAGGGGQGWPPARWAWAVVPTPPSSCPPTPFLTLTHTTLTHPPTHPRRSSTSTSPLSPPCPSLLAPRSRSPTRCRGTHQQSPSPAALSATSTLTSSSTR